MPCSAARIADGRVASEVCPAGTDHPGRTALDLRAARDHVRALRGHLRAALLDGQQGQLDQAETDRVDSDDPRRSRCRSRRSTPRQTAAVPVAGPVDGRFVLRDICRDDNESTPRRSTSAYTPATMALSSRHRSGLFSAALFRPTRSGAVAATRGGRCWCSTTAFANSVEPRRSSIQTSGPASSSCSIAKALRQTIDATCGSSRNSRAVCRKPRSWE